MRCWRHEMVACTESKQVEEGAAARRTASCGAWQWVADPAAMPSCWEEREHVLAGRVDAERANELRYISRRRSEAEEAEVLAREEFADRRKHPDREARPAPARVRMPDGALVLGKIDISQLYNAGVYDEIRRLVRQISSGLKSAEMELSLRGEIPRVDSKLFNAWARESVCGTRLIRTIMCRCSRSVRTSRQSSRLMGSFSERGRLGCNGRIEICCSRWCLRGAIAVRSAHEIRLFLVTTPGCGERSLRHISLL